MLRDTTSRGLCVRVWPPHTSERRGGGGGCEQELIEGYRAYRPVLPNTGNTGRYRGATSVLVAKVQQVLQKRKRGAASAMRCLEAVLLLACIAGVSAQIDPQIYAKIFGLAPSVGSDARPHHTSHTRSHLYAYAETIHGFSYIVS